MKRTAKVAPAAAAVTVAQKAAVLRRYGFNVKLRATKDGGIHGKPHLKAAVSRLYNQHRYIYHRGEGHEKPATAPVKFQKTTSAERRAFKKAGLSSEAFTPGGVFIQVPRGVKPKDYSFRVRNGRIEERVRGQTDYIIPIRARDIVGRETSEIKASIDSLVRRDCGGKKPRQVQLMVGGNEGRSIAVKNLGNYMRSLFAATVLENRRGAMTARQFSDKFQLRVICHAEKTTHRKGKVARRR